MPDTIPGFDTLRETEEVQIWGSGPDNQHQRYETKIHIKSTVTDSGNTPTTTLRGGLILARKTSDGLDYKYDPTATDGTQRPIGILEKHTTMLDRYGTAADKVKNVLKGGLIQNTTDLGNVDLMALAVLLRTGFMTMDAVPNGSAFLYHPVAREFKTADYTITAADNGKLLVAATNAVNYTLPTLAAALVGFQVQVYQSGNNNLVVTAAADTIIYDDTTGGKATTLTWSTANQKMGAGAILRADYDVSGTLSWYVLQPQRTVVAA